MAQDNIGMAVQSIGVLRGQITDLGVLSQNLRSQSEILSTHVTLCRADRAADKAAFETRTVKSQ